MPQVHAALALVLMLAACGGGSSGSTDDAAPGIDTAQGAADADRSADASDACVPTEPPTETCDDVDNDCNGLVDDVDVGGDGLYDCQTIALFGEPGSSGTSNFVAWLASNGTDVVRMQGITDGAPTLTAADLAPHQVIILDNLRRAYTVEEAGFMTDWVTAGGGLMVLSGYTGGAADYDEPNSLLTGVGLALGGTLTNGPVTMFAPHPVTEGITSVTFLGGFHVAEVEGVAGGVNTVVATIADQPVGVVQQRGEGRVFVWGDEWITFDSQWDAMPEIQAFWANSLGWLGGFI